MKLSKKLNYYNKQVIEHSLELIIDVLHLIYFNFVGFILHFNIFVLFVVFFLVLEMASSSD